MNLSERLFSVLSLRQKSLEFWEEGTERSATIRPTRQDLADLEALYYERFGTIQSHPFKRLSSIRQQQLKQIKQLVSWAYETVPFYRNLYDEAGFDPAHFRSWEDFRKLPLVHRQDLQKAGPEYTVSAKLRNEKLYSTISSSNPDDTFEIRTNREAVLTDTLFAARQFWLQSNLKYSPDHLLAHINDAPSLFDSVAKRYRTAFISTHIGPVKTADILRDLRPRAISLRPTTLEGIRHHLDNDSREDIYLGVVHSEITSKAQRKAYSEELGFPVLDEYSTKDLTRIALELPCGHYHFNEDEVYSEILDPKTFEPVAPGEKGILAVTNLHNHAMPFIRYIQPDFIRREENDSECEIGWSRAGTIQRSASRTNASHRQELIPA